MITKMHIENFKCFKDFDIDLGPFNVLIGPNDSGKTAFLQALALFCGVSTYQADAGMAIGDLKNFLQLDIGPNFVWRGTQNVAVKLSVEASSGQGAKEKRSLLVEFGINRGDARFYCVSRRQNPNNRELLDWIGKAVGEAKYYHLDPVALRQPSRIASSKPFEMSADGTAFPTFLEDMLRADRQAFFKTEEAFYQRFPQYTIDVPKDISPNGAMNVLKLKTKNGQSLTSQEVSDGALLYLAYLAISHQPNPPGVMLVEEPENGVHHSALKQIIEALASLSKTRGIQVILTTHSPYLLDFVEPENVQVFLKDSEGAVHATKMSDSAQVKDLQKDFMTGEIWTVLSEEGLAGKTQVKP